MGRGFLTGAIWGIVVAVVVVVIAARVGERVELSPPAPEAGAVDLPPGTEFNRNRPDEAPVLPGAEAPPAGEAAPEVAAPEAETAPEADTAPAEPPEAGGVEQTMAAPEAETPPEPAPPAGEEAVTPDGGAVRPPAPGVDAAPEAVPPAAAPETASGEAGLDAPDAAPGAGPGALPEGESDVTPVPETAPPESAVPDVGPAAAEAPAPAEADTEAGAIAAPPAAGDAPPASVPDAPPAGVGLPVPEIAAMNPEIPTDQLPRIGADPEAGRRAEVPAIEAHAEPFENATGAPVFAVVLFDPGPGERDPAALGGFPMPLSVAVDPTRAGAEEATDAYRAAGLEVAALTPLAEGATPADVEVAFQSFFASVPRAVAVMDVPGAELQANRPRAVQVARILAETGHGLVTYDSGLNAGLQVAAQEDVPAATVFRRFDGEGRDVAAMKRFLDQGAFRAGIDGPVIMVGALNDETLAALAEWVLGTRAGSVALAPLSAALLAQ